MIRKVISGGQTGADLAGLRAAKACKIPTGGWAPKGFITERGPRRALLKGIYGLKEHASPKYPPRTIANIEDSSITLLIADDLDSGSGLTLNLCNKKNKPCFHIKMYDLTSERRMLEVFNWLCFHDPKVINVAGNRESKCPGIEKSAIPFLKTIFTHFNAPTWRNS